MSSDDILGKEKTSKGLMKAAWLIAVVIVFSKIIGFFRDVVIANFYGAGCVSDAYFYAYQIPSLALILIGGVGGPFHSAVVSIFSKIVPSEKVENNELARKLFNTFLTVTFIVMLLISICCFIFSDVIMHCIINNGSEKLISLASLHLKIMSPILIIGGLVGIYYGILVVYGNFLLPNISPTIMSIVIIIMISFAAKDTTGIILALATTVGALCQFTLQLPGTQKLGFRFKPTLSMVNSIEYKNIVELLMPAILSSTIGQIYIYVDMFFASSLKEGSWTAIGYANRIFQFPVGILVTAFLVPLFPLFSKLVSQKNDDQIRYYFNKGVGLLNYVAFPILIGIILLGYDAIAILFQRGAFDSNATFLVNQAFVFLSVALIPYIFRDSITRIYYAFNDSMTPFIIAFSSVLLKIILNFLLVKKLGIGGITLSTSLVTLVNAVLLGIFISKKIKLDFFQYFLNLAKMFISAILSYFLSLYLYKILPTGQIFIIWRILKVCIVFTFSIIIYATFTSIFKLDYSKELILRLKKKIYKNTER